MTPETLTNRISFTATQKGEQKPIAQSNNLDRRLHQYRSKLLAATNKSTTTKSASETSKSISHSASNNTSETSSRNQTAVREHQRDYPTERKEEKKVEKKSVFLRQDQQVPVSKINNSESTEFRGHSDSEISTIEAGNSGQLTQATDQEINVNIDEQYAGNEVLVDDTTTTTLENVNLLPAFHQINQLQQPVETIRSEEQDAPIPQALTRLFSRFDQLSVLKTETPALNATQTLVIENEIDAALTQTPTIPAGLARFFSNGITSGLGKLVPEIADTQSELPLENSIAENLILETNISVPVLNESFGTTEEQIQDSEFVETVTITQAEVSSSALQPIINKQVQNAELGTEQSPVKQNQVLPQELSLNAVQTGLDFEEVILDSTSTSTTTTNSPTEIEESSYTQTVIKNPQSILSVTLPTLESGSSKGLTENLDQPVELDNKSQIDPSFYASKNLETNTVNSSQQNADVNRGQQIKDIIDQVKQAFSHVGDGPQSMRIRLNPPELGMLQIDILRTEGGIVARVQAESPQAHQLIKEGIQQLKESLALQGQLVQSIQIDLSPDLSEESDSSEQQQKQEQQNSGQEEPRDQRRKSSQEESFAEEFRKEYITEMDMEI